MAGILWLAAAGWHFEYLTQIFNILDDGVAETKEFSTQNKERKNNFQCLLKVTLNTVQRTRPEECSSWPRNVLCTQLSQWRRLSFTCPVRNDVNSPRDEDFSLKIHFGTGTTIVLAVLRRC